MSLVFKQIRLYAKLTLFIALALVVGLVVYKNRDHRVTVWFFATYESINVLWLMLCTAGATVVTWWILALTRTVWRDMKVMFREQERQREQDEIERRKKEITEAEKRIDRKIKTALHDDNEADKEDA